MSAAALGFARGLNDTPKVLTLLVSAQALGVSHLQGLLAVASAMVVGGVLHSRRLAETLGKRITTLNPGQGLLANLVGSLMVIGASLLGSPVSTTHVTTGAILGIGAWNRSSNWRLVVEILLAWVVTLPVAALVSLAIAALW
jgi:PiT family inorganic phosphate transporter